MNQKELAAKFRKLGAADPEGWAQSQLEEGIPQLARFLFLRQAWRQVVEEGNSSWIDSSIERAKAHPDEPYAGVGHALKRLRARGATDEDITDVVRGMQAQMMWDGFLHKSMGRGTSWLPLEDCTSPYWRLILPGVRCGLEKVEPANNRLLQDRALQLPLQRCG